MALTDKQKKELRKILEKISTPEEMKAFDLEMLKENNDKATQSIIDKIDQNKPEKTDLSPISLILSKLNDKLSSLYNEFINKKYPTYDDSKLNEKLDSIQFGMQKNPILEEAESRRQKQMVDELNVISDILAETKDILDKNKDKNNSEQWVRLDESLQGIGLLLKQISTKTGTHSNIDKLTFTGDKLKVDAVLETGDIEIGAVEIKDGTSDTRAVVDSDGLNVSVKKSVLPTGASTEETLQSVAGFNIPKYDQILATYPDTSTEVYTYKLATVTVGVITVVYSDAVTKAIISSVTKS